MSKERIIGLTAIITAMLVVNMVYAVTLPLLSLTLSRAGYAESIIGFNTMAQPLAALVITPFLPSLIARFGPRLAMLAALVTFAISLLILPLYIDIYFWSLVRPLMGISGCILWVASEAWINAITEENIRGRVIGIYSTAGVLGWTLGPLLLLLAGTEGFLPYALTAAITLTACIPMMMAKGRDPDFSGGVKTKVWLIFLIAPIPLMANLVTAASHEALSTFFVIYAEAVKAGEEVALSLLVVAGVGGLVTQYPLGWLADKVNRTGLMIATLFGCVLCAVIFPQFMNYTPPAIALFFFWGMVGAGIYSLGITLLGEKFKGADLASAATAFTAMYSIGILIGPPATGAVMDVIGPEGLSYSMIVYYVVMVPIIVWSLIRGKNQKKLSSNEVL